MASRGKAWSIRFFGTDYGLQDLPSDVPAPGEYDVSKRLAGPMRAGQTWEEAFAEYSKAELHGRTHILYAEWQEKYGGTQGLAANIVVPKLLIGREDDDAGLRSVPRRILQVVIANPQDAARIARVHVRKQKNFTTALYGSIISTTDNEHWKAQREHLVPAFLPKLSLSKIFPISVERAKACAKKLFRESEGLTRPVDMNEFFLFETEAQLQLALFGEDEDFMEQTNKRFRLAMSGVEDPRYVREFCNDLVSRFPREKNACPVFENPELAGQSACPFNGPLANRLASFETDTNQAKTAAGNALIFAFAGHDTTAHTLTWLTFELARHPEFQQQLQNEVDAFWDTVGDRNPTYEDLELLPFMTRCMMETLRLWPAVASGTFREIQFDDYVKGPEGEEVLLKKGTQVQIVNWSRHRNPQLWGADADLFNPNREFRDGEVWHHNVLAYYNPATERFSPFTFPPRGCIGMNFAQLESRLMLCYLLKEYSFELTETYKAIPLREGDIGVNYGTLAPRDLDQPKLVKFHSGGFSAPLRAPTGLPFLVHPRSKTVKPRL